MSQVHRLSLVAKILQDKAFAELVKENERLLTLNNKLELTLFWKDHCVNALCKAMSGANQHHPDAPHCVCIHCSYAERADGDGLNSICSFKPWFENKLTVLEIKTLRGYPLENVDQLKHICSGDTEYVLDVADAHLVNMAQQNWTWFTFGALLWKATSIQDLQIQKLAGLFDELNKRLL